MSDFKAKVHQIRFQLGALPLSPSLGSLQRFPEPLAFKGPTSNGGRRERMGEEEGKGGKGRGAKWREC